MWQTDAGKEVSALEKTEIEEFCRFFLAENYGVELAIPVVLNPRLTRTLGSFIHNPKTKTPIELEFSKKFMENAELDAKIKIIKHECIHYALFVQEKPYKDGEALFEEELIKHNSVATDTLFFITERNVRVYSCACQEHIFQQTISAKICTKCRQRLVYSGRRKQLI